MEKSSKARGPRPVRSEIPFDMRAEHHVLGIVLGELLATRIVVREHDLHEEIIKRASMIRDERGLA